MRIAFSGHAARAGAIAASAQTAADTIAVSLLMVVLSSLSFSLVFVPAPGTVPDGTGGPRHAPRHAGVPARCRAREARLYAARARWQGAVPRIGPERLAAARAPATVLSRRLARSPGRALRRTGVRLRTRSSTLDPATP